MLTAAVMLIVSFAVTVLILRRLIPYLASRKIGQKILEIGPRWHKSKEGTPTMGGISFIIASTLCAAAGTVILGISLGSSAAVPFAATFGLALAGGLIGAIDDSAKVRKAENEGLTAKQKFALQVLVAAIYVAVMRFACGYGTEIYIPYFGVTLNFGFAYYIIAVILICGIMNSVNLTDGIDGLAASTTGIVGIFFVIWGFFAATAVTGSQLLLTGGIVIGACGGFLVYNFHPARIFMGDTGSLYLGALLVGTVFMAGNPLIIVIAGLCYIIETASVMLQVGYFKLTHGKRLFRMAPIHHHFEKCGLSEVKVVALFSAATVIFCALALLDILL